MREYHLLQLQLIDTLEQSLTDAEDRLAYLRLNRSHDDGDLLRAEEDVANARRELAKARQYQ